MKGYIFLLLYVTIPNFTTAQNVEVESLYGAWIDDETEKGFVFLPNGWYIVSQGILIELQGHFIGKTYITTNDASSPHQITLHQEVEGISNSMVGIYEFLNSDKLRIRFSFNGIRPNDFSDEEHTLLLSRTDMSAALEKIRPFEIDLDEYLKKDLQIIVRKPSNILAPTLSNLLSLHFEKSRYHVTELRNMGFRKYSSTDTSSQTLILLCDKEIPADSIEYDFDEAFGSHIKRNTFWQIPNRLTEISWTTDFSIENIVNELGTSKYHIIELSDARYYYVLIGGVIYEIRVFKPINGESGSISIIDRRWGIFYREIRP